MHTLLVMRAKIIFLNKKKQKNYLPQIKQSGSECVEADLEKRSICGVKDF